MLIFPICPSIANLVAVIQGRELPFTIRLGPESITAVTPVTTVTIYQNGGSMGVHAPCEIILLLPSFYPDRMVWQARAGVFDLTPSWTLDDKERCFD